MSDIVEDMIILEQRYPEKEIRKTVNILKFNNNIIKLVGTGSLKSQLYPSDYDFMTKVNFKDIDIKDIYNEFVNILNKIYEEQTLYFIEFKFQNKDKTKYKFNNINEFSYDLFKEHFKKSKIDFIKIDVIINIDNLNDFKEVSCIYFSENNKEIDIKDYTKVLKKDMKELYNEGKYYKSLKRLLIISKINNNFKMLYKLTNLFNSDIGKLYLLKSKLEACILLLEHYKDKVTKDRVKIFLKNNGLKSLKLNNIVEVVDIYNKEINDAGFKFIKDNNIKI
jgi:hypothetical protein